jgi:hypothetical protein
MKKLGGSGFYVPSISVRSKFRVRTYQEREMGLGGGGGGLPPAWNGGGSLEGGEGGST